MENQNYHHDSCMGDNGLKRERAGNEGSLPMLGHVVSLLSALVSIIGIISDNLGKNK